MRPIGKDVLSVNEKRALWPSFCLGLSFLLAVAATALHQWWVWWLAAVPLLTGIRRFPPVKGAGRLLIALSLWVIFHTLVVAQTYRPEALYFCVWLLGAYLLSAQCDHLDEVRMSRWFVGAACIGALWVIVQATTGVGLEEVQQRPGGPFPSPNTMGTVLASALCITLVHAFINGYRLHNVSVIALLLSGLWLTQSRGALLALAAGVLIAWLCTVRHHRKGTLSAGLVVVSAALLITIVIEVFVEPTGRSTLERVWETLATGDTAGRLDIYRLAWWHIGERPFLGHGYLSFEGQYLRSDLPVLNGHYTEYVHNDYLQLWLDLGLPGVGLAVLALFIAAWSARRQDNPVRRGALLGLLSLIATNAAVDFPLYVPSILILLGVVIGRCDHSWPMIQQTSRSAGWARRWAVIAGLGVLAQPVAAQLASDQGRRVLATGDFFGAEPWLALAGDIAPYSGFHDWTLGVVWAQHGRLTGDRAAIEKALAVFARGDTKSAYDPRNALFALMTRRDNLSTSGESSVLLLADFDRLRRQWPNHELTQLEYLRTLLRFQPRKAQDFGESARARFPNSKPMRRLYEQAQSTKISS